MSHARFYIDSLRAGHVRLTGDEARHAARVRRLHIGDTVSLFDAAGRQAEGVVMAVARDAVDIAIHALREPPPELHPRLTLAVAPPKGPRGEWMIEKAAELGVAAVWPMTMRRGVAAPGTAKLDKWRRIAREANKQSGRADLMVIEPLQPLTSIIGRFGEFERTWLADPRGSPSDLGGGGSANAKHLMLIGPEGGLAPDEHESIVTAGAQSIRIADTVLRIETAAIAAAAIWAAWRAARQET